MLGFIHFSSIMLFILVIFQVLKLINHKIKDDTFFKKSFLILLIPVVLGFTVNPENFSSEIFKNKTFSIDSTLFD